MASCSFVLLQILGVTLVPLHESVAAIAVMFLGGQVTGGCVGRCHVCSAHH